MRAISRGKKTFGARKQFAVGVLDVGNGEVVSADGPGVTVLHGWPYGVLGFVDAAPWLAPTVRAEGDRPPMGPSTSNSAGSAAMVARSMTAGEIDEAAKYHGSLGEAEAR